MPVIGPYLDELQKWLSAEGFGGSVLMMLSNGQAWCRPTTPPGARSGWWSRGRRRAPWPASGMPTGSRWSACCVSIWVGTHRQGLPDRRTANRPSPTPSRLPGSTGSRRGPASRYRCRRWIWSRSEPVAALWPISTGSTCSRWGPESAGADPGPASYGRGGTTAAVTDADVVLGLLDPDAFLGGDMPLDGTAATAAVAGTAAGLGLSVMDTAAGISEVVDQNMAAAARMHGVEHGRGPARGHDSGLRRGRPGPRLRCGRPPGERQDHLPAERERAVGVRDAGVAGADRLGPLHAPAAAQASRAPSGIGCWTSCGARAAGCCWRPACGSPRCGSATGWTRGTRGRATRSRCGWAPGSRGPASDSEVLEAFDDEYRQIYGMTIPDVAVEAVTWRLSAYAEESPVTPEVAAGVAGRVGRAGVAPARGVRARCGSACGAGVPEAGSECGSGVRGTGHRGGGARRQRSSGRAGGPRWRPTAGLVATRSER